MLTSPDSGGATAVVGQQSSRFCVNLTANDIPAIISGDVATIVSTKNSHRQRYRDEFLLVNKRIPASSRVRGPTMADLVFGVCGGGDFVCVFMLGLSLSPIFVFLGS